MKRIKTDICVIGGGSGGLSVASGAVQMGASVVLLEGGKMGGDCLNYGCVPSKALISAARLAKSHETGEQFGITPHKAKVDFEKVMGHVKAVIAEIEPHDSVERFEGLGVNVIKEYGQFISKTEIQAGQNIIKARRFVIATGSSPFIPPIEGLSDTPYLTNETIFELSELPEHLLIIGGGPIGMELAQAFMRLGSRVTVVEAEKLLGRDDPEMAQIVIDQMKEEGVEFYEGCAVENVTYDHGFRLRLSNDQMLQGSHLLVAAGRRANIAKLGLEKAEIATQKGAIAVNAALKTSNKRVYAIGDVTGGLQFTHVAGYHAGVVLKSALFALPSKARADHIPRVTYTAPEIAQIGLTEHEARLRYGDKITVLRIPYAKNDRARASHQTQGLVKLTVYKGRPIGVSIAGAQAGELINTWALAFANHLKIGKIANMIAPYPSLGELNKHVAGQYFAPKLFNSNTTKWIVRFINRF